MFGRLVYSLACLLVCSFALMSVGDGDTGHHALGGVGVRTSDAVSSSFLHLLHPTKTPSDSIVWPLNSPVSADNHV